jgi:hypothetical protein
MTTLESVNCGMDPIRGGFIRGHVNGYSLVAGAQSRCARPQLERIQSRVFDRLTTQMARGAPR